MSGWLNGLADLDCKDIAHQAVDRMTDISISEAYSLGESRIHISGVIDFFEFHKLNNRPRIEKVIFNGPATAVLWSDGDKTVVKCNECGRDINCKPAACQTYQSWRQNGVLNAVAKKLYGNEYVDVLREWCE